MTKPIYVPYYMADVRRASEQRKFTVISTFCGGGGSSIGYMLAGGRVLLAIDHSAEAIRTYKTNFATTLAVQSDVRKIAKRAAALAILEQAGIRPGEIDLLDASPPCNEFSRAGRGPKPGGTADLIFELFDFAKVAMPRVVVIENVPELATRYGDILENALDELRFGAGGERVYFAAYKELIASEYGAPQKRKRLIVIVVRADVAGHAGITTDAEIVDKVIPKPLPMMPVTMRMALTDVPQGEDDIEPWRRSVRTTSLARLVPRLEKNPAKSISLRGEKTGFTLIRPALDEPACTMTASGQKPDFRCGVLHPTEDRKPSIPEFLRLNGCPDDYKLTGTLDQCAERLGMMVLPAVMKAVAEHVYEKLLRPFHQTLLKSTESSARGNSDESRSR
jgi:site-specific DNA-cytosine methylase